ncbi:MAG: hypothetical protein Ct9H90mP16_19050 [Candidatus Poseidoniales archaeon]|nr:MAG: hypothetical protein Ct9H90mP16_19050 [Candidatus Poseidoniales archaeon]
MVQGNLPSCKARRFQGIEVGKPTGFAFGTGKRIKGEKGSLLAMFWDLEDLLERHSWDLVFGLKRFLTSPRMSRDECDSCWLVLPPFGNPRYAVTWLQPLVFPKR